MHRSSSQSHDLSYAAAGGRLIVKPRMRKGRFPQDDALFLIRGRGIGRFRQNGRNLRTFAEWGEGGRFGPELDHRLKAWVRVWASWSACLPKPYTPLDCREFDVQSFNREGLAICREILPFLPEGQELCFNGLKRSGAFHRTFLMERWLARRVGTLSTSLPPDHDPDKTVKVMAEYGGDALWLWSGPIDPDDLPISAELSERIAAWGKGLITAADTWLPGEADVFQRYKEHDERKRRHADRGLAIAQALKRELPDWTVIYFDADLADRHSDAALYHRTVS